MYETKRIKLVSEKSGSINLQSFKFYAAKFSQVKTVYLNYFIKYFFQIESEHFEVNEKENPMLILPEEIMRAIYYLYTKYKLKTII